jgi:hypothetical protein
MSTERTFSRFLEYAILPCQAAELIHPHIPPIRNPYRFLDDTYYGSLLKFEPSVTVDAFATLSVDGLTRQGPQYRYELWIARNRDTQECVTDCDCLQD